MGKHELELIAALAEGRLEDESEARALIASSAKYRIEYEAQKAALDALGEVATAKMTEIEKAALHRDIWTAVSAEPVPAKKATHWYLRWSYAAAALFVLVSLVAVLNQGDFSADTAGDELALPPGAGQAETTTPAALTRTEGDDASLAPGAVAEDGAAEQFLEPDPNFFSDAADRIRAGDFEGTAFASSAESSLSLEDMVSCVEEAGLEDHETLGLVNYTGTVGGELDSDADVISPYIVATPADLEVGPNTPVSFVDLSTCVLVHIAD